MALKPIDAAAYAVVRTFIEAGASLYSIYQQTGHWPKSDPPVSGIMDTIFGYVSRDSVPLTAAQVADDPDCAIPGRKASCFYLSGDIVFTPQSRAAMIADLNSRTPASVLAKFSQVPEDSDLEWWAIALSSGVLLAVGGLPFAGAAVAKIAGWILAAWTVYGFVTPKTPGGQSIAMRWKDNVADGLENFVKKAGETAGGILKVAAIGLVIYLGFNLLKGK